MEEGVRVKAYAIITTYVIHFAVKGRYGSFH